MQPRRLERCRRLCPHRGRRHQEVPPHRWVERCWRRTSQRGGCSVGLLGVRDRLGLVPAGLTFRIGVDLESF
jgi:hypothetical protein